MCIEVEKDGRLPLYDLLGGWFFWDPDFGFLYFFGGVRSGGDQCIFAEDFVVGGVFLVVSQPVQDAAGCGRCLIEVLCRDSWGAVGLARGCCVRSMNRCPTVDFPVVASFGSRLVRCGV